jgi:hypothetical protein
MPISYVPKGLWPPCIIHRPAVLPSLAVLPRFTVQHLRNPKQLLISGTAGKK